MIESDSAKLWENVNAMLDRISSLEIDNFDLRNRIDQLEKKIVSFKCEHHVKKVKPPIAPKRSKSINGVCLKESDNKNISEVENLSQKIDQVENKIANINVKISAPPLPLKPPDINKLDSLKSNKTEVETLLIDECKLKNVPVLRYLQNKVANIDSLNHQSEIKQPTNEEKDNSLLAINPMTNKTLPYTLHPLKQPPSAKTGEQAMQNSTVKKLTLMRSFSSDSSVCAKRMYKSNSLNRKKCVSQTFHEYSPVVNSVIKKTQEKVKSNECQPSSDYDLPMFKSFRESLSNVIKENKIQMTIKSSDQPCLKSLSVNSISSLSSQNSLTGAKSNNHVDQHPAGKQESNIVLRRIKEIENCLNISEPSTSQSQADVSENSVFNKKNRMAAIVPYTLATVMIAVDEALAKDCTDGETKNCEIKDSTLEKDQEVKRGHILSELLETERIYVNELGSIIQGYKVPLLSKEAAEFAPELDGKVEVMFGNFEEIYTFHNDIFLQDLENCISTTELVALCFTHRRDALHKLYSTYCQNIARSERFRESIGDHVFLKACQTKLGHKLPLAAYLLKPVQRITKYQLLLKELLSYSEGKKWCNELQEALECMLVVLKCVNDSMHQLAVTNFWGDLGDLGDLLMQGGFSVWTENKKDRWGELRLKPMQSHLFLYQKALMFCKKTDSHNKETYLFKKLIMMSDVGLTETVKGDGRTFEIWLTGRSEVHRIKAANQEQKAAWVEQIKTLLLQQLTQLKLKQHTTSKQNRSMSLDHYHVRDSVRGLSCDDVKPKAAPSDDDIASYSDCSNPDDEETFPNQVNQDQTIIIPYSQGSRYRVLADYNAVGHSELSVHEGDLVTLLKVGLAGWWYVRLYGVSEGSRREGWVPAAYLEHCARKSSRSCQSVCSDTSSH
ncbi:guanine nucleotide exchange factor DBS-like isoform X7 [Cimex lectularius]|uniref:Guanine nucleotide exchange factor DBS-like n=1 Tax=Cimex lectularius TaxID=79782 RepID=A0A8I6RBP9_CIMLE|nr:guanine nucleotide exchange factor DBS-like isoform X7 [Cimex lectularius]